MRVAGVHEAVAVKEHIVWAGVVGACQLLACVLIVGCQPWLSAPVTGWDVVKSCHLNRGLTTKASQAAGYPSRMADMFVANIQICYNKERASVYMLLMAAAETNA